eukprot:CAMPEP_0118799868 /NCGR_PEP_ID=MMETSP1161-20130426/1944_1 /TAXON_ID=249345 /ORGANISM="Picochlorum oklahomensis, Strain CCMP2329" /LENGTH=482 /DNA_ID=CAMNT_0006727625 /DNA_START=62 /DNA_END=1513 /DNA_ORIENTATION=+
MEGINSMRRSIHVDIPQDQQCCDATPTATFGSQYAITEDEYRIFQSYDLNKNGRLEIDEFQACMKDLGILGGGRRPGEVRDVVVATFASLDTRKKNALCIEDFIEWYRRANAPKLEDVLVEESPQALSALREAFLKWSMFGNRDATKMSDDVMTSFAWMKLCRDCGLVSKSASRKKCIDSTEADLIFAKVKARGKRKICFSQFIDAVGLVAEKSGRHVMHVIDAILAAQGPVLNGTVVSVPVYSPRSVRSSIESFRSSYSNGSILSHQKKSPAEVSSHSRLRSPLTDNNTPDKMFMRSSPKTNLTGCPIKEKHTNITQELDLDDMNSEKLLEMYGKYASFGGRRKSLPTAGDGNTTIPAIQMPMDSKQFSKLCRESGLCQGAHDGVKIDLIFTKALTSKARRLMFEDFLVALSMLAVEKKMPEKQVFNMVCESQGPQTNTSPAEFVRLHDEPSMYTGVYARGGPDPTQRTSFDLQSLLRREM